MKRFWFVCLFLIVGLTAFSQVRYSIDPKIKQIQADYIKAWEKVDKISGYRIQVTAFSGNNSRNRAENERAAFQTRFPYISIYLTYSEPYFKLRAGNYLNRLDAYKDLKNIQLVYPNAYIVPDFINFRN